MRTPNGETHRQMYGFSDVSKGIPVTSKTCFGIGSLTKSFTAISILQLQAMNKLSISDPITEYFPQLRETVFDRVTIHNLLSHTSGVSTLGNAERWLFRQIYKEGLQEEPSGSKENNLFESMKHADEWTVGEPGKVYSYLNEGYSLLHDLVGIASGISYEEYIEKNIFRALDMQNTFFLGRVDIKKHKIATGYSTITSKIPVPVRVIGGTPGSGSIYSNLEDMSKFLEMLVNRGTYGGREIIESEDIEKMESIHINVDSVEIGPNGPTKTIGIGYGYGLSINSNFHGHKLLSHGGSVFVYTAYMGYLPDLKTYVISFCNSTSYPLGNIGQYALTVICGNNPSSLSFIRNESIVKKLVGSYCSYGESLKIDISASGDYLYLKPNYSHNTVILVPELIAENHAVYYTLQGYNRVYANFTMGKDKRLEVNYSGQRLKKMT